MRIPQNRCAISAEDNGAARRFGYVGLNITHPCEQSVIPHLNARMLAAADTAVFEGSGRSGTTRTGPGQATASSAGR
ncbi:hypothetical protein E1286_21690 [Nonomuraea terrae]|uniref:Uncharacterized protein n=1 Tax=Nonomuraea terrae TaxID=2530383 RepID=A0A4R4YMB3_9ACTN|nr:hypothetical protein E1286_21690 [Nonomuraea terrae]